MNPDMSKVLALGAQAGEKRLAQVMGEAGFRRTRRAAETPFNIVLDCRVNWGWQGLAARNPPAARPLRIDAPS